jgi:hypothetical protein
MRKHESAYVSPQREVDFELAQHGLDVGAHCGWKITVKPALYMLETAATTGTRPEEQQVVQSAWWHGAKQKANEARTVRAQRVLLRVVQRLPASKHKPTQRSNRAHKVELDEHRGPAGNRTERQRRRRVKRYLIVRAVAAENEPRRARAVH